MAETAHWIRYQDSFGGYRTYYENEKGQCRDEYGNTWSPPIKSILKRWQVLPIFDRFGETMTFTKNRRRLRWLG